MLVVLWVLTCKSGNKRRILVPGFERNKVGLSPQMTWRFCERCDIKATHVPKQQPWPNRNWETLDTVWTYHIAHSMIWSTQRSFGRTSFYEDGKSKLPIQWEKYLLKTGGYRVKWCFLSVAIQRSSNRNWWVFCKARTWPSRLEKAGIYGPK